MFDKVLIANRGEIALRIMRSLKKMGIKSTAIYSEADTNSMHVQFADEAVYVGPSPATDSYLHILNILKAIRRSGATAVHPGYGFLSENYEFAKALKSENVELIGPSAESIKLMGDKITAKKIAIEAGVSTVPGFTGEIKDVKQAIEIASGIGFPVMLKAAAGGGGKGMRVVFEPSEMQNAFDSARREATNSFSDGRVFIEKFIQNPRHIEIQLLADKHGNAVCLGERECSIQRHHQKVIEEAPSVFITEEIRQKMYEQVKALAAKVGYYSAGTVEFIVDEEKNFYFLEMNTRLQVEHCVTELVTGIDIVEEMIKIADGQKLSFSQDDVKLNGWAIESRIYAEDPTRGFIPSTGRIVQYEEPEKSANVRVDSGVREGSEVSMFYDPMIAKLCTYAPTRIEAIVKMQEALGNYVIRGISHNISFLEAIMFSKNFISGDISTNFIHKEYPDGFFGAELNDETTRVFLAVAVHLHLTELKRISDIPGQVPGREKQIGTRWVVKIDDNFFPVFIKPTSYGYNIRHENKRLSIRSNWTIGNNLFQGLVNEKSISVKIENIPSGYHLTHAGTSVKVYVRSLKVAELEKFMPEITNDGMDGSFVSSPITGLLTSIKVKEGEMVKAGQVLAIVEAMKMENNIIASKSGKVVRLEAKAGQTVQSNQVLLELE